MDIQRVITCTDFSEAAIPGVEAAFSLAKRLAVPVHLVHVFAHPIQVDPALAPTTLAAAEDFLRDARKAAEEHLRQRLSQLKSDGVQATCEVLEGAPSNAIRARCEPGDLLVVSTHGRTGVRRMLLGSVAERLVRTAPCPVLTVPSAP